MGRDKMVRLDKLQVIKTDENISSEQGLYDVMRFEANFSCQVPQKRCSQNRPGE